LAPQQVVWWGHPVTSGIRNVDYFLSSSVEIASADQHYSEKLFRLNGLGTFFLQPKLADAAPLPNAVRESLRMRLALPSKFHLYLCAVPLYQLHPAFDKVLAQILTSDRRGQLVLITSREHSSWAQLLATRLTNTMSDGVKQPMSPDAPATATSESNTAPPKLHNVSASDWSQSSDSMVNNAAHRIHFLEVRSEQTLLALMRASNVVLDPFPVSNAVVSFQALGVGAPVVTMPGDYLKSRLTLAMLERLNVPELVATSEADYARIALSIAHSEEKRAKISDSILKSSGNLFEDFRAIREWERFLKVIAKERAHEENLEQIGQTEENAQSLL